MIDNESKTNTEWIGDKEQVRERGGENERAAAEEQRERTAGTQ